MTIGPQDLAKRVLAREWSWAELVTMQERRIELLQRLLSGQPAGAERPAAPT